MPDGFTEITALGSKRCGDFAQHESSTRARVGDQFCYGRACCPFDAYCRRRCHSAADMGGSKSGDVARFAALKVAISYCGLCGAQQSSAGKVTNELSQQRKPAGPPVKPCTPKAPRPVVKSSLCAKCAPRRLPRCICLLKRKRLTSPPPH